MPMPIGISASRLNTLEGVTKRRFRLHPLNGSDTREMIDEIVALGLEPFGQ